MEIERLIVGQMTVNCYLIWDRASREALIVDPGDEGEYIAEKILELELAPKQIVATHGHFDHIMGVFALQFAFDIPFLISKKDDFLVNRMRESAKHFLGIDSGPAPKINGYVKEGDVLQLNEVAFETIETPGHTPGSISLINRTGKMAIVGDLIFAEGRVGRTDFSYSNKGKLMESVKKIDSRFRENDMGRGNDRGRGNDVLIAYPGHGESFTLAQR